jgi:hypothetical protein
MLLINKKSFSSKIKFDILSPFQLIYFTQDRCEEVKTDEIFFGISENSKKI